jgi:hypothetical protein
MATLPYTTATGNIDKALNAIKSAATPDAVSQDYVKTILGIKGGSGNQITSYLKKIGFAGSDGKPTELYTQFRNPSTAGAAVAAALRVGYGPLYKRNEYMHQLSDDELKGLVIEETGAGNDSSVPGLIVNCINALKAFANFDAPAVTTVIEIPEMPKVPPSGNNSLPPISPQANGLGMNLSYTINLNLPATSDIAVFNAIFKSLKENLLNGGNE